MNEEEKEAVRTEISKMVAKGAIRKANHCHSEFISNLFVRPKKDNSFRPIINLKFLNQYIPYQHFKIEQLNEIKNLLNQGDSRGIKRQLMADTSSSEDGLSLD